MENNQGFITTVSVYSYDRDYINHLSEEIGLSQKRIVSMLVEAHKSLKLAPAEPPNKEQFDKIVEILEKLIKRDDRVIAFIKEQESVLLKPIFSNTEHIDQRMNQLISILSNLE